MKYEIVRTSRFKTAYKRVSKLKNFKEEIFVSVVETLASGQKLDKKHKDHALIGNFKATRECHLAPDILLIYHIDDGILVLTLVSVGSHSQLFK
jgi:mRNA interferase YafQ